MLEKCKSVPQPYFFHFLINKFFSVVARLLGVVAGRILHHNCRDWRKVYKLVVVHRSEVLLVQNHGLFLVPTVLIDSGNVLIMDKTRTGFSGIRIG